VLDWNQLRDAANGDGEFQLHARYWTATLWFDVGETRNRMRIADGVITEVSTEDGGATCDLWIAAEPDDWHSLLERLPKPFYHDLIPAAKNHGFEFSGSIKHKCAYYPALRRLIDLMREVRHGEV
jgi:hypothetical protein